MSKSPNIATRELALRWNLTVGQTSELKAALAEVQYGGIEIGLQIAAAVAAQHPPPEPPSEVVEALQALHDDIMRIARDVHGSPDRRESEDTDG